jgi:hypothetical protein
MRYYRLNFEGAGGANGAASGVPDVNVSVVDAWIEKEAGERVRNVEQGEPIGLQAIFEARQDLEAPIFGFHFLTEGGETLFGFNLTLTVAPGEPERVAAGERVRIGGRVENRLLPGRYFVHCFIARNRTEGDYALHFLRLTDFVVYGTDAGPGSLTMQADVEAGVARS